MFSDFTSFCFKVISAVKHQALVILLFVVLGGVIGTINWSLSKERYRNELLIQVDPSVKKSIIARINFLDAEGKGNGDLGSKLGLSDKLVSQFSDLKAENVQDTSLNQFNLRYFVEDTSLIQSIDGFLTQYVSGVEGSSKVLATQLFTLPSSGIRSILSFLFMSLSMGIVIGMFREARSQKS